MSPFRHGAVDVAAKNGVVFTCIVVGEGRGATITRVLGLFALTISGWVRVYGRRRRGCRITD